MVKKFEQYNESLRDKMTPVSEEDIRSKMGEEKYRMYKIVQSAKDSIKPPFEFTRFNTGSDDDKNINLFGVHVWYIKFEFSYDGKKWEYILEYNGRKDPLYFDSWDDVYEQMILDTNKSFNKEIIQHQKEINIHQKTIDDIKKELENINNDTKV